MKYLPFLNGKYSVAPNLLMLEKMEEDYGKYVFQIDDTYKDYLANKQACRNEYMRKYYCEERLNAATAACVNRYIVFQLLKEYPAQFYLYSEKGNFIFLNKITGNCFRWREDWLQADSNDYLSLFDALACQVQEDIAICQLEGEKDWMAAIHVCAPNYWSPSEKAGKPFNSIHAIVPGMDKTIPHYFKMLTAVVNKGPYTRFAWGIATDNCLNHHPAPAPGADPLLWKGRNIEKGCDLYVRVEKQSLIGFAEINAFFFTIRTYFYPVDELNEKEKVSLLIAIETMSPESLSYKGLEGKLEILREMLS